jgi:multidrug efflux system membrane fusion protein
MSVKKLSKVIPMARLPSKKVLIVLIGVVGVTYLVARQFMSGPPAPGHGQQGSAMPVSVAPVLSKSVQQWNEYSGRLVAIDKVDIRPRVSGMIDAVHFQSGALVKKGDLLFTIDPRPFQAEVARAQGVLRSAEADRNLAQSELTRAEKLIETKVISASELDNRKNNFSVNQARYKSAEAALDSAKLNLEYTRIKAPVAGKLSRAEITPGNIVEAGFNAPILTSVVSSDPIFVDFDIDESAFVHYMNKGAQGNQAVNKIPVLMGLATESDLAHKGFIESFDNEFNTTSGTIRARAVFPNPNGNLVPGLFARIKLGDARKTEALLITDRAVGTDQNKKFVFVVDKENKVVYREVKLGAVVDGLRIVQEGLNPNDNIIVNGIQRARPGVVVAPEMVTMDSKG